MVRIDGNDLVLDPGEKFLIYVARAAGEWDDNDGIIIGVYADRKEAMDAVSEYIAECGREFDEDDAPWVDIHLVSRGA